MSNAPVTRTTEPQQYVSPEPSPVLISEFSCFHFCPFDLVLIARIVEPIVSVLPSAMPVDAAASRRACQDLTASLEPPSGLTDDEVSVQSLPVLPVLAILRLGSLGRLYFKSEGCSLFKSSAGCAE